MEDNSSIILRGPLPSETMQATSMLLGQILKRIFPEGNIYSSCIDGAKRTNLVTENLSCFQNISVTVARVILPNHGMFSFLEFGGGGSFQQPLVFNL